MADVASESLSALTARVHGVKPFPLSAHRVIAAAANPATTTQEVASILEMDPGLAARVLRLVNSAGYGVAGKCKTVAHAVALLGPTRVAEVATTAVVMDLFGEDSAQVKQVLDHSVGVAAVARRLAQRFDLRADDVFTCALLHDIGKLMMLEEPGYEELLAAPHEHQDDSVIAERERYGFDHAVLAGMLLTKWKLPRPIPEVVAWHHSPTLAYEAAPSVALTIHLLRLADALVLRLDKPEPDLRVVATLASEESATALDLTAEDLERTWPDLYRTFRKARGVADGEETLPMSEAAVDPLDEPAPDSSREATCGVCGINTFGQSCPRCTKPLCALHAPSDHRCCTSCEEEFAAESRLSQGQMRTATMGSLAAFACALVLFVLHRVVDGRNEGPLLWLGTGASAAAVVLVVARFVVQWRARARFFAH